MNSKNDIVLKMCKISKSFPGVKALSNVDFTLRSGEIHALMGENGAGKSTLIKVLTGVEQKDEGEIYLFGKKVEIKSPQHAQELGISTVYQEVNLCPNLSVAENLFIGREPVKKGRIDWNKVNSKARELLAGYGIDIDVTKALSMYSVAVQQMVAIARAVDISAKVLIFDEPTSSLEAKEVEKLFEVMRKLKESGISIIFITHFIDQVYKICDRITVLRNGQLIGEYETASLPKVQLVAKMIGKDLEDFDATYKQKKKNIKKGEKKAYLEAKGLGKHGQIKPYDLKVNEGEVLGFAGLLGSGRTEMAKLIFGAEKSDCGEIYIKGQQMKVNNPLDGINAGIGYCPEDRKTEGIVGDLSVRENIILALQAKKGWFKYLSRKEQENIADEYIKLLDIKTPDAEQLVKNLSGGNQQKVLLARWLITNPGLLILDEPTRGIDVGTKAEIQKIVLSLAEKGMSVIFISSELDEMLRCCNRMVVLKDKEKVKEIDESEVDENAILCAIAGGAGDEKQ